MKSEPSLRAVTNHAPEPNYTKELIKTIVLTSAVSSLVGVFAVAGGQALVNAIRRTKKKVPDGDPSRAKPVPVVATMAPHPHGQHPHGQHPHGQHPHGQHPHGYPTPGSPAWGHDGQMYLDHEDMIPDSLRMEPRLRSSGSRRRGRSSRGGGEFTAKAAARMFGEFEARLNAKFEGLEQRVEDIAEDGDGE